MKTKFFPSHEFCKKPASISNGFDFFDWVCRVPINSLKTGNHRVFENIDDRPYSLVKKFKSINKWKILELGPLEGGHTYQLEKFGAELTAIEAHPENFLKCLIVKNALNMKASFLLGDFSDYLKETSKNYDLIFASGVFYHMEDPLDLLVQIAKKTDRIFAWTHYISEEQSDSSGMHKNKYVDELEFSCKYYHYEYDQTREDRSFAGIAKFSSRLTKEDFIRALCAVGFSNYEIVKDEIDHPGGPAFSFIAEKK